MWAISNSRTFKGFYLILAKFQIFKELKLTNFLEGSQGFGNPALPLQYSCAKSTNVCNKDITFRDLMGQ